jgi:ABC-type sugar transport system ATPase subunit
LTVPTVPAEAVVLRGICKSFPGVDALKSVDLVLNSGEVHAVVGENGAGKSTLLRVLAGAEQPDAGIIDLGGTARRFSGPADARALGISTVYQETSLFGPLSIAENIFSWGPPRGRAGFIMMKEMRSRTVAALATLGLEVDPTTRVAELTSAQRQLVEIARATMWSADVLILDEPTSSLSGRETDVLFREVRRLRDAGMAIAYISHRLEEVLALADRVTVLRDGAVVGSTPASTTTADDLIRMMVGRELTDLYGHGEGAVGDVVLDVAHLTSPGWFEDVSFTVRSGEIVGLGGLVGAGRTEVAMGLFGMMPTTGTVKLNGRPYRPRSPAYAMAAGVAYVTEDRRVGGLFPDLSVMQNLTVTQLARLSRGGFISSRAEHALAEQLVRSVDVRTATTDQAVRLLSGGNQQKVLFAKWLGLHPSVLIVDEPTRGVDIGAKAEIYRVLREHTQQGAAVLFISSDLPELIGVSDRVVVMHEGSVTGELAHDELNEEAVLQLAYQHQVA